MMRQVFISDLHLSLDEPALCRLFWLLDDCLALPNLKRLFILGDWFEVWLGDDVYLSLADDDRQAHWLTPLINKLKQLRVKGCEILVMHGNRDFLLDRGFLNLFGGELIDEPYSLDVGKQSYRLEHGDALCSDDKKYQWFRKVIRHRLSKWYLLNKSLSRRLAIADNIRAKSKLNNRTKDAYIMESMSNRSRKRSRITMRCYMVYPGPTFIQRSMVKRVTCSVIGGISIPKRACQK